MKFLRLKYIIAFALVITVGIFALMYFVGGLEARAIDSDNLPFSLEGYVDYSDYSEEGKKFVPFETEAEKQALIDGVDPATYVIGDGYVEFHLKQERIVAQNDIYTMFFNEHTTTVSVVVNKTCDAPNGKTFEGFDNYDKSTCGIIYDSASTVEQDPSNIRSNLLMTYIGSNGKESTPPYNTIDHSVFYENQLKGIKERHYSVKYLEDGVEVLYDIGNFMMINSFFPKKFDREKLLDYFVGNTYFVVTLVDITLPDGTRAKQMKYNGAAVTWSKEVADYIEENGLGVVSPVHSFQNAPVDEEGNELPVKWNISGLLETDEEGRPLNKLKLKMGVDYNSVDYGEPGASPIIANPFAHSYIFNEYLNSTCYFPVSKLKLEDGTEETYSSDWSGNYSNNSPYFELKQTGTLKLNQLYDIWYRKHTDDNPNWFYYRLSEKTDEFGKKSFVPEYVYYDENPYDDIEPGYFKMGGFHKRDENGKFLYDENGEPIQELFSIEDAQIQNEIFGESAEVYPPVFRVAMRFTLNEAGMDVAILDDSIIEGKGADYKENGESTIYSHNAKLGSLDIMPNFTTNNDLNSEGYIILPDGSGAIMQFNSPKSPLNYQAQFKEFYGADKTFTRSTPQQTDNNKNFMLNMYGFLDKTAGKGVLAIVDRGASQAAVYADFKRAESQYLAQTQNTAYFRVKYREKETVSIGTWARPYTKWSTTRSQTDFIFKFVFLEYDEFVDDDGRIDYVKLAEKYRDYLIDKYKIEEKDNTDKTVLFLNMLGSFEKRKVTLGIPYTKDYSLTTYEQARSIIEDLQAEGFAHFMVSYMAWTNEAMEPEASAKLKPAKVLGGSSGMSKLAEYMAELEKRGEGEFKFYPELNIASNKGYDFNFGDVKYTARSISNLYAHHRPYELINTSTKAVRMISPRFYHHLSTRMTSSLSKLSLNGAYLSDIGNFRVGDYRAGIFPEKGKDYQIDALDNISGITENILLSAPFDYALSYATAAVDIPLEASLLKGYDYSIPFYQLVISGLFDYAGIPVNFKEEHSTSWYILKALETGSNLYYYLSYEDPKILNETDYSMYYNTYYANWKNDIIRMKNIIDETRIHEGRLISHKILQDNVVQVEYSHGVKLIINYNLNTTYYDVKSGLSVRPSWFAVVEGGNL